jgi:hypothetical protein
MRKATASQELKIDVAEGKCLLIRVPAGPIADNDSDAHALEIAIDVTHYGIVGPYMKSGEEAAIRFTRGEVVALLECLQRSLGHGAGPVAVGEGGDVSVTLRPGIERATWQPRRYTEISFDGLELHREFRGPEPDYRTFVLLYPQMVANLVKSLQDVLLSPAERNFENTWAGHYNTSFEPTVLRTGS